MKRIRNALALLGLIVAVSISTQVGVERARAAFWQWSQSASLNGNSDPNINWAEGMPPSVVNDSARAMMAALAQQAADTSGGLQTTGGPTAFTVTTNQGFSNPPLDGQLIGVTFNANSSGNPTLAVDGGTAYPVDSVPGTAANVVGGSPTTLVYNATSSVWLVRAGAAGGVPLGALVPFTGTVVPSSSYVFANGQCISTTTYATYWALVGSPAPGSCSAGNFAVLDVRGRALVGLDNLGGASAAGRLTTAARGCGTAMTSVGTTCANGVEAAILPLDTLPNYSPPIDASTAVWGSLSFNTNLAQDGTASNFSYVNGILAYGSGGTTQVNTQAGLVGGAITAGSINSGVTPQMLSKVMPVIGVNYLLRVQ